VEEFEDSVFNSERSKCGDSENCCPRRVGQSAPKSEGSVNAIPSVSSLVGNSPATLRRRIDGIAKAEIDAERGAELPQQFPGKGSAATKL
jgi:hypothetical protein